MKNGKRKRPMKHVRFFIFTVVILFYPAYLPADVSSPIPAVASCCADETQMLPPPCAELGPSAQPGGGVALPDVCMKAFDQPLPLSDIPVQDEASGISVAQNIAGEEKVPEESAVSAGEEAAEEAEAEGPLIADPFAPFNKLMFQVNDKLYFWLMKPIAQGYSHVVIEPVRIVLNNVFDNLKAPARIVDNLLQLRFKEAGNEFVRFLLNTVVGIGGAGDFAKDVFGIKKQDADFGQMLGHHGIGHGFYLVLPLFGPTSLRDGVGLAADRFMYPLSYISMNNLTFGEAAGIFVGEKVNETSLTIGDYEAFKESTIDPYIAMRDAFVQYRQKKVEDSKK